MSRNDVDCMQWTAAPSDRTTPRCPGPPHATKLCVHASVGGRGADTRGWFKHIHSRVTRERTKGQASKHLGSAVLAPRASWWRLWTACAIEFDLELTSRQWPGLVVVDELQSDGSALLPCSELTFFDFPCHVRMPPFARQLAPHQPTDQDGRRRHLRPGPVQHCEGSAVCRSCMCDECQETICPAVHCSAHEVGRGGCFDQCVHAAKEKRCMPGAAVAPADVAARPPACLRAHVWQGSPMGKPSAASRRTSLPTGA